jgi:hypothetical protein
MHGTLKMQLHTMQTCSRLRSIHHVVPSVVRSWLYCLATSYLQLLPPLSPPFTRPPAPRYYDLEVGTGAEATPGERIAIHYDVKFRGITFMSSR